MESFCVGTSTEVLEEAEHTCAHIQSDVFQDCHRLVSIVLLLLTKTTT